MDTLSSGTGIHLEPLGVATGKRRLSEPESASLGYTTDTLPTHYRAHYRLDISCTEPLPTHYRHTTDTLPR